MKTAGRPDAPVRIRGAGSLYAALHSKFREIPDHRAGNSSVPVADVVMSAMAVFVLRCPSLLQFEETRRRANGGDNMLNLFGVAKVPSDTQARTVLDRVDPGRISPTFKFLFGVLQRGGHLRGHEFATKGGRPLYLVPVDGTGHHSSEKVRCKSCLVRNHRDGRTTHHHQALTAAVVHPERGDAVPLFCEGIMNSDGNAKNDCELAAFRRLAKALRADHPGLGMVVCGDGLYARGALVAVLRSRRMSYILNVKPKGNAKLFDFVGFREAGVDKGPPVRRHRTTAVVGEKVRKTVVREYRYGRGFRLDNSPSSKEFTVNFVELREVVEWVKKGRPHVERRTFSWATDLDVDGPADAVRIAAAGRSRWRIENGVHRTLKCRGYNFGHNFGHGNENLSFNFALLAMIALLSDLVLRMKDKAFREASSRYSPIRLRERMRAYHLCVPLAGWRDFLGRLLADSCDDTSWPRPPGRNGRVFFEPGGAGDAPPRPESPASARNRPFPSDGGLPRRVFPRTGGAAAPRPGPGGFKTGITVQG